MTTKPDGMKWAHYTLL